jgi:hypothetical protein
VVGATVVGTDGTTITFVDGIVTIAPVGTKVGIYSGLMITYVGDDGIMIISVVVTF